MLRSQLRIVSSIVLARVRPRQRILDSVTVDERVMPWDLDLNLHMNNSQYLKYSSRNLSHYFFHSQYLGLLAKHGWNMLVVSNHLSYLRPLLPLANFTVTTRLAGHDDKYVYLEQSFDRQAQLHASVIVRTVVIDPSHRPLAPGRALSTLLGRDADLPRPLYAQALSDVAAAQRATMPRRAPRARA